MNVSVLEPVTPDACASKIFEKSGTKLDPEIAAEALGKVKATFDRPKPYADDKTIFKHLLKCVPKFFVAEHLLFERFDF